jgi:hypothetical protein
MQQVIDIAPSAVPYLVEFAEMLEQVGDDERALTHYERARDLGAEAVIHLRLARLYKQFGATAASQQAMRLYTASIAGGTRCEGDSCP